MSSLRVFLPGYNAPDWFPVFARMFVRDVLARRFDVEIVEAVSRSPHTADPMYDIGSARVSMHTYAMAIQRSETGALSVLTTLDDPLNLFLQFGFDPSATSRVLAGQYVPTRLRADIPRHALLRAAWPSLEASPVRPWLYRPLRWQTPKQQPLARSRRPGLYFRGAHWQSREVIPLLAEMSEPSDNVDVDCWPIAEGRGLDPDLYFERLSEFEMALSVAGVGDICNRDIECFAMGVPVLRPVLQAELAFPLEAGVHYIGVPYEAVGGDGPYPDHPRDPRQLAADILDTYRRVRRDPELLQRIATNARAYYEENLAFPAIAERTLELLDLGPVREEVREHRRQGAIAPTQRTASPRRHASGTSAELQLLSHFARPLAPDDAVARAAALTGEPFDWDRFLSMAQFHGVIVPVAAALGQIGTRTDPVVRAQLRHERVTFAATELLKYARWRRACSALADAGIRAVTMKGFHVAFAIYGGLGQRLVGDFDFLVHPRDVAASIELFERHGYHPTAAWQRAIQHVGLDYIKSGSIEMSLAAHDGLVIDLHWAVTPDKNALSAEEVLAAAVPVSDPSCVGLGSSLGDTLAMLVVHGEKHGWTRLRWLVDVVCGLEKLTADDALQLRRHLERVGGLPAMANAVALIERTWDAVPQMATVLGQLPPANARVVREVRERFERGWDAVWAYDRRRPLRLLRDRFALSGVSAASLASALRPSHLDWAAIRLPAPLRLGYYAVRPVRVVAEAFQGGRAAARRAIDVHATTAS